MNLLTMLDATAGPRERGYTGGVSYRIEVNGKELKRGTYVFAVLGFGMAKYAVSLGKADEEPRLKVVNGVVVEGLTFGRIKVEPLIARPAPDVEPFQQ